MSKKLKFITYQQNQLHLCPPTIEEAIEPNHMVRFIDAIIDKMDIDFLFETYKGGGRPAFHPRMLLKVLVYAYTQNIYTSRKIAKALRENIHFMWLSGMSRPDFRTINRFRSSHLKDKIDEVFAFVIKQLLKHGFISMNELFIDGSKFEANANKYKAVWKKNIDRHEKQLQKKIKELLKKIDKANEIENQLYGDKDLGELGEDVKISSEELEKIVAELNKKLNEKEADKELKKAKNKIEKDFLPRQRRYEAQRKQLNGRSNYSKTDVDATLMKKRPDIHGNVNLLPSYNVQVGSSNQYIVHYYIGQNANDGVLLKPFLENYLKQKGRLPEKIIGDAGYGIEENYEYCKKRGIEAYLKYLNYYKETKLQKSPPNDQPVQMKYDADLDRYECSMGRYLEYEKEEIKENATGYKTTYRVYRSKNCDGCIYKEKCAKGITKSIWVNEKLNVFKEEVKTRLSSKQGQELIRRRGTEIETVFGQIKQNFGVRRFLLRGLKNVNIEFGLIATAYNLKKMYKEIIKTGVPKGFKGIIEFLQFLLKKNLKKLVEKQEQKYLLDFYQVKLTY